MGFLAQLLELLDVTSENCSKFLGAASTQGRLCRGGGSEGGFAVCHLVARQDQDDAGRPSNTGLAASLQALNLATNMTPVRTLFLSVTLGLER